MKFRKERFCTLILGVLSLTARADFITGYGWVSTDPIVKQFNSGNGGKPCACDLQPRHGRLYARQR